MKNAVDEIPDNIYEEFEKESQEYVDSLFSGVLLQELYSLRYAKEMAKTCYIAGKVKQINLDKNK